MLYLQTNPGNIVLSGLTSSEVTFIQSLHDLPYATGDILYYDGSDLVNLSIGLEDQILSVSDAGIPEWIDNIGGGGTMDSVVGGTGIDVDNTDPVNPVINLDSSVVSSLSLADSSVQPGDNISDLTNDAGYITSAPVTSVNSATGVVVLDADDIDDTSTTHKFVTSTDLTKLSNLSGTNSGDVTVSDTSEIDLTLTGQQISATIVAGSIDESKLDTSVNASLDLADSAVQSGDLGDLALLDLVTISDIDATGTPSSTTYLRGDGTWATPAGGGGGTMDNFVIDADSGTPQTIDDGNTLSILGGTGIDTVVGSTDTITVSLDPATQSSLGLADSAIQSGDNISVLTNDAGYITATLTEEQVEDYVGGMVTGNTETLITVTYQDGDGTLDFVVEDDLSMYDNTTSDFATGSDVSSAISAIDFPVDSVNGQTNTVVLDADDIDDTSTTNKFTTSGDISKLAGIESGADVTDETNVVAALSGATLTDAGTPASDDKVLILDTNDSNNLKYVEVSELGGGSVEGDPITDLDENTTPAGTDIMVIVDDPAGTPVTEKITLTTLKDFFETTLADLGITASSSELNILDGAIISTTELNYLDNVTSNVQTQLNAKLEAGDAVMGTIVHGATAGTARPSGFDVVTWIGSIEPTNATNNDIWIDTA